MNYDEILEYDVLREVSDKCKCNVSWKDSVVHYEINATEETIKLSNELKNGTYKPRKTHTFTITSPKVRQIVSVAFRDRVYQRALNDNILYPVMSKSFIYDNFACQIGKGTDKARERLKEFMHKAYRKHGCDLYVLQLDIKKYYDSMNHELVEKMFREKLDDDSYKATVEILRSQYPGDTGYNPGSQMVQIAGVSFLDGMDHFIKEKLHIKYYLRYMDDAILIHESKEYLEECLVKLTEYLKGIQLQPHEKKTKIYSIDKGINFLGFKFRLTETGKVLIHVHSNSVKRAKRRLKKLVKRCNDGLMTRRDVDKCFNSWLAHIRKGNSYLLEQRMKRYYAELWRK